MGKSPQKVFVELVENPETWDNQLEEFNGSLFMTGKWIDIISAKGRSPVYFRFIFNGNVIALLGGIKLLYPKYNLKQLFFYSGIAAKTKDPELIRKCKLSLYEYAKKNNYFRIRMRSYDHISSVQVKLNQFKETQRIEFITFLDKDKSEIFKSFDSDVKRRARIAKSKGVLLKNSKSISFIEKMMALLEETRKVRRSKGYGEYDYSYLPFFKSEAINRLVSAGHASFYYAEFDNEILSIQFVFECQGKAFEIFEGTTLNGYKMNAPSFMMYEVTGLLKDRGYKYYNHGGVPQGLSHAGLKKFKAKIGAISVDSYEGLTSFITFPLNLLNPFFKFK
jgi:hypothetical protein